MSDVIVGISYWNTSRDIENLLHKILITAYNWFIVKGCIAFSPWSMLHTNQMVFNDKASFLIQNIADKRAHLFGFSWHVTGYKAIAKHM